MVIDSADGRAPLPADTRATVAIAPAGGRGAAQSGHASQIDHEPGRQFVALLMDHEGPFEVRAVVESRLGAAEISASVDATYDERPAPAMIAVYLVPFVLFGGLWLLSLRRRRRARAGLRGGGE